MRITKQAKREAKALYTACLVNGRLDEARVRTAVRELLDRRPRGYPAVLAHFKHLMELDEARRSARIESAAALPADLRGALEANLARKYGPGLKLAFTENPALLGGLRVQVGSDVYDGSVRGRLNALAASF
jgi:F-type H+-transporting ATPase subunit delta